MHRETLYLLAFLQVNFVQVVQWALCLELLLNSIEPLMLVQRLLSIPGRQ